MNVSLNGNRLVPLLVGGTIMVHMQYVRVYNHQGLFDQDEERVSVHLPQGLLFAQMVC